MSLIKIDPSLILTEGASNGDVLKFVSSNSTIEFGSITADTSNSWVNANDYATYTTVSSLIDTVQANLTSVIGAAPSTLDTLAEIAAALENDANIAVSLTNSIGQVSSNVDLVQDNVAIITSSIDLVQDNVSINTSSINTVQSNLTALTSSDLDMGGNKVLFGNMYANEASLPSASTYHGMFAHVHDTGKGYFAHAGSWIKLLDETSSTTSNLTEGTNLYYSNDRVNTALNTSSANTSTVLSWDGTDYAWVAQSSGGTNYPWSNVSSNVSASAGDKLFVDTSTNAITITLPASPAFGSEIRVIDIKGNSANNKITLDNNGNNIEGITDSLEVNINRAAFGLVFYDATEGWVFIEK
tara:strand:+ start:1528 stop:2592 length:1065 start_codon:yes stop_codon:yes gene_type:complete